MSPKASNISFLSVQMNALNFVVIYILQGRHVSVILRTGQRINGVLRTVSEQVNCNCNFNGSHGYSGRVPPLWSV